MASMHKKIEAFKKNESDGSVWDVFDDLVDGLKDYGLSQQEAEKAVEDSGISLSSVKADAEVKGYPRAIMGALDAVYTVYMDKQEESKKNEADSVSAVDFWNNYIKDRTIEILESYDVNSAQGGDAWENIGDGVEERETRWDIGALQKSWETTLGRVVGQGVDDETVKKEYDRAYEAGIEKWRSENGDDAPLDTEEFYDFIDSYTTDDSCTFFAEVRVVLDDRGHLMASLGRNFDYSYGADNKFVSDMDVSMSLADGQFTKENADKFLDAFEDCLTSYSFSYGYKDYTIEAV